VTELSSGLALGDADSDADNAADTAEKSNPFMSKTILLLFNQCSFSRDQWSAVLNVPLCFVEMFLLFFGCD
jgi:hypothetical protein